MQEREITEGGDGHRAHCERLAFGMREWKKERMNADVQVCGISGGNI